MSPERPRIDLGFHGALEQVVPTALELEASGAGALFVSEATHDPFVPLAAATSRTRTLELGTAVAIAFSRTPMSMAYAAHDLQRLSGGRLTLGLGTQIAPHIVKRFGMPWSAPAARMREYVAALHAIWDSWETGDLLDFRGDFYEHTLMPELFSPGPLPCDRPPILLAAVGPRLLEVAADVADGVIVHPLTSADYLHSTLRPAVERRRRTQGCDADPFTIAAMVMVASGRTEEEFAASVAATRRQIAFYASTPAYLPLLAHHGWEDLHLEAREGMRHGRYQSLGELVDDVVLRAFAVVGEPAGAAAELAERYAGVERVIVTMPFQDVGPGSAAVEILAAASPAASRAASQGART